VTQEPLVLRVGHVVDAGAQRLPARLGEKVLQQMPVLDDEYLPSSGREHALKARRADVGDDPIQRLPVEVDDPHHLAQLGNDRVEDGFPAGALVQFRIT
jgi:hypothetical protein